MAGQPKAAFYAVLFLMVAGLVAFAVFRKDIFAPSEKEGHQKANAPIDPKELGQSAEAADANSVTTVKEYKIRPSERLAPVIRTLYSQAAGEKGLKVTEAGLTQRDIRKKIAWIGAESIKLYLRKLVWLEYLQAGGSKRRGARNTYCLVADEAMDRIDISMIPTADEIASSLEEEKTI